MSKRPLPGSVRQASGDPLPEITPPTPPSPASPREKADATSPSATYPSNARHEAIEGEERRKSGEAENGERRGAASAGAGQPEEPALRLDPSKGYMDRKMAIEAAKEGDVSRRKVERLERALSGPVTDLRALRDLAWSGLPPSLRPIVWQLLVGYRPAHAEREEAVLRRKRSEYHDSVRRFLGMDPWGDAGGAGARVMPVSVMGRTDAEQRALRQILVDIPRMSCKLPLFQTEYFQRAMERVLYVWAIRHPASGYVQGMDGVALPFFAVYMSPYADYHTSDLSEVPLRALAEVEADVYWSLSRMLDSVQDNYTPSQPGVQRMIFQFRELLHRINEPLVNHIEGQGVDFQSFAHRFMNCILVREFPLPLVIRLWDTYLAAGTGADGGGSVEAELGEAGLPGPGADTEEQGFRSLHVYMCAALMMEFADRLKGMRMDQLMRFLQDLPTHDWSETKLEEVIAQAYVYQSMFGASPSHLR